MRVLVYLMSLLLAGAAFAAADSAAAPVSERTAGSVPELVFLTWSEYIDPDLITEFEAEHGVRVRGVYFETNTIRNAIMGQHGGAGFDLVLVDNTALAAYRGRGWLAPLPLDKMPNVGHIAPRWRDAHPDAAGVAVPYFWGTLGIAYRSDLTGRALDSWMDLLRPSETLAGRILMVDDNLELPGIALKALGHSFNSADPAALDQAARLLLQQRPAVKRYGTLSLDKHSELLTGEVAAAMAYSGDAVTLQEQNPAVTYVIPREGGAIWMDFLAISAKSRQIPLAAAFIDFLNRPEIAARNARFLYYATPNQAAEALLPKAFRSDRRIYPDNATLERCESHKPLPAAAMSARVKAHAAAVHGN